jgi:hypothetical protein
VARRTAAPPRRTIHSHPQNRIAWSVKVEAEKAKLRAGLVETRYFALIAVEEFPESKP